ncbi:MAG: RNA helicase [Rhizobiales bacterium 62-17]|nr:DEAD/DEAH box helicase [Hyphomicrobiales bacterium]OJY02834.1 MAG: RNA helicase [Rhizobiales bacterium 62-17]
MTDFAALGVAETILRALRKEGYETPTPIQAQAIPHLIKGHDLLGIAQTGTGKTAAFALPILTRFAGERKVPEPRRARALVLAPTRELVAQIAESFRAYSRFMGIQVAAVVGGVSYGGQVKALSRGVDVLVATPGRLLDHMDSGNISLATTDIVVLDEADHMFDLGFIVPIRKILAKLPKQRQSLFFSATMPKEIATLAAEFLKNPVQVAVTPVATTAERVRQEVIMVDGGAKQSILIELLKNEEFQRTIVFTRTKRGADRVSKALDISKIPSAAIHGNKSQGQRVRALDDFKQGRIRVLVATDIAARGIDVSGVSHVINFELPEVPESYVHRIGRTARAGAEGVAVSLCENSERALLRGIEKLTRMTIPAIERRSSPPPSGTPYAERQAKKPHRKGQNAGPRGGQHPQGHRQDQRQDQRSAGPRGPAPVRGEPGVQATHAPGGKPYANPHAGKRHFGKPGSGKPGFGKPNGGQQGQKRWAGGDRGRGQTAAP